MTNPCVVWNVSVDRSLSINVRQLPDHLQTVSSTNLVMFIL